MKHLAYQLAEILFLPVLFVVAYYAVVYIAALTDTLP